MDRKYASALSGNNQSKYMTGEGCESHIKFSNLDKIMWPEKGYVKSELISYYVEIAPYILKHLKNRPMVFTRFPDGIKGKSFYQKNAPDYLPDWIPTFSWYSDESKRNIDFILVEDQAALAWLANQACIEMHPWLSCKDSIDYPDFVVFDLDPAEESPFADVVLIAQVIKELFDKLNLKTYLKTSGGDGLHIYLPIINKYTYKQIRIFAQHIAGIITAILPGIATIERTVKKRGSKVYVDYLQNVRGKTLCSAYSVRPRAEATVSTPISWQELQQIHPTDFTIKTVPPRLKHTDDLFASVLTEKQSLDNAVKKLNL